MMRKAIRLLLSAMALCALCIAAATTMSPADGRVGAASPSTDDATFLQALYDAAPKNGTIVIPRRTYVLSRGLVWLEKAVNLDFTGSTLLWRPTNGSMAPLLTFGGASGKRIPCVELIGGEWIDGGGIQLRNVSYSKIRGAYFYNATPALTFVANNEACSYNDISISAGHCHGVFRVDQIGSGWSSMNKVHDTWIDSCEAPDPILHVTNKSPRWPIGWWMFDWCDMAGTNLRLCDLGDVGEILFRDCRFEFNTIKPGTLGKVSGVRFVRPSGNVSSSPSMVDPRIEIDK
jgi:hypothetical protein